MRNAEQLSGQGFRFVDKKREPDINEIKEQYGRIMAGFSDKNRPGKESKINDTFQGVRARLEKQEDLVFEEPQKAILKLKLARHFQKHDTIDHNTLSDAIIESPKFVKTDKGSLHHLLEVHTQKTTEKIAEIRKKRAEMTGDEGINPCETLFTTKSGKYYLARLFNRSHLQEESEYMGHCVGTSDSYINEIKRGKTEIFSLRNTKRGKLKKDKPVLTIEYSPKTGIIEQIKKKKDRYLDTDDLFFEDAVDALKRLRDTQNDLGNRREINKINPTELLSIRVKAEHFLTDQGEIHFMDLDPKENPLILKAGIIPLTGITNIEAAKLLQIFEHLKLNPEQIALQQNEINENTKAYVGRLETSILEKIHKYGIRYVYTGFPEGNRIENDFKARPITFDELSRKEEQNEIYMGFDARGMLQSKDLSKLKKSTQINPIRLKPREFGAENAQTLDEVYDRAKKLGLELCPWEVAPLLALKYPTQSHQNGNIYIGMKPIPIIREIGMGVKTTYKYIFEFGYYGYSTLDSKWEKWVTPFKEPETTEFVFCLPTTDLRPQGNKKSTESYADGIDLLA